MTWVQSSPSETQLSLVERDQRRTGRTPATIVDRRSRQACHLPRLQVLPDYTSHICLCLYPKGHKRTPIGSILILTGVPHLMFQLQSSREVSSRFSEAEWLKNQVKVAKTDPGQFCDFRRWWYNPFDESSAQQGWRHGVHSRSLGGTQCRHLP
jgi:hypothetical protein